MVDIPTGLGGAEDALQRGLTASGGLVEPFAQGGRSAFELQTALTGAGGPEAQSAAFANFKSSPGQQFLRDRAEQSLLRNQSAIGGIGGGNVRRALQEQAVGLASQDFGNQFNRLGTLSNLGSQAAGLQSGQAFTTGRDLASGRTRAGENIASAIGDTTSALANLQSRQGQGISDLIGSGGGNLANLLSGAGAAQGGSQQQLATLLANLSVGQGSQIAGLPGIGGIQETGGQLDNISKVLTAIGLF